MTPVVWGNDARAWLIALAIIIGLVVLLLLARSLVQRSLSKRAAADPDGLLAQLADLAQRFHTVTILFLALWAASNFLILPNWLHSLIQFSAIGVGAIQVGIWVNRVVDYAVEHRFRGLLSDDPAKRNTLRSINIFIKIAVWIFVVLAIVDNIPGVNLTGLITGLGVTGIAISLAIQSLIGDLLASLAIALDRPFVVGDYISNNEFSGTVESIGWRSTRVRSLNGELVIFSNSNIISNPLQNFSALQERRRVLEVRVDPSVTEAQARLLPDAFKTVVDAQPDIRFERAYFKKFDDRALLFEVSYFVESAKAEVAFQRDHEINLAILRYLQDNAIPLTPAQELR